MACGWLNVFEIKSCFRRDEYSPHHDSEFLMLEWYRGFKTLDQIVADLDQLIQQLTHRGWSGGQAKSQLEMTDFESLFRSEFDFSLTPTTSVQELHELCRRENLEPIESDTFNDLVHRLMIEKIEPRLKDKSRPTVVRNFPPSMAALARLNEKGWADRFELYWNGLEIANAFYEVIEPAEQAERWRVEREERKRLGTGDLPEDETLIEALEHGLPPSAGIALGIERLYMAMMGVEDIRELKQFPGELIFR
jgi:elongation factor P--(R)-beta-lysine ligase